MVRPNEEVEALLQEHADLIAITGGEAFKARAYEKAARSIGGHPADVSHLDVAGLKEIPGVGRPIAEKVIEYFRTGMVTVVEERWARIPAEVRQLITIPTLGPKKAMALYETLHISSRTGRPARAATMSNAVRTPPRPPSSSSTGSAPTSV